ncbi:hypothetical protein [Humisphaera borealis]|uniref:Aerotolerance regulator N-terminal domain-containing protein n=1 Tax=Humisphaera borealis TaxID=2807512 RepID=A0A7M2WYX1_9BACT|nr:hypothetical protein [Humisphaera borealis]QOV89680.1 hypothetical protein IPV69_26415 [Humisphaera borealis]
MLFAAPIWLFGLIPWGIVAVVLLMSRRPRTDVPYLDLWTINAPQESIRRSFSTPPAGVILVLLAVLLVILAAASPSLRRPGIAAINVVVDTCVEMSSRSDVSPGAPTAPPRYVEAGDRLAALLEQAGAGSVPVDLIVIPGRSDRPGREPVALRTDAASLRSVLATAPPTAVATAATVDRVVSRLLADPQARVIVLSDRRPIVSVSTAATDTTETTARWAVLSPSRPVADNIGIRQFSVRRTPAGQAMVALERSFGNGPELPTMGRVALRISSGGQQAERSVDLPRGARQDLFVDLPAVGDVITAELVYTGPAGAGGEAVRYADAFPGDDRADLIAEANGPVIEPSVSVGELDRLIGLYSRARPAGDRSVHVRLTSTPAELGTSPGVILPAITGLSRTTRATRVVDHPVLGGADLASIDLPATVDRALPAGRWDVVLADAFGPLVAVRATESPAAVRQVRQAWCAIDPRGWGQQVAYVVFWSAMLDWLGEADGRDQFVSHPLNELTPAWIPFEPASGGDGRRYWPGIYQRDDGVRRAFGPTQAVATAEVGREIQTKPSSRCCGREAGCCPWHPGYCCWRGG